VRIRSKHSKPEARRLLRVILDMALRFCSGVHLECMVLSLLDMQAGAVDPCAWPVDHVWNQKDKLLAHKVRSLRLDSVCVCVCVSVCVFASLTTHTWQKDCAQQIMSEEPAPLLLLSLKMHQSLFDSNVPPGLHGLVASDDQPPR
jgi:hypothetical protein